MRYDRQNSLQVKIVSHETLRSQPFYYAVAHVAPATKISNGTTLERIIDSLLITL